MNDDGNERKQEQNVNGKGGHVKEDKPREPSQNQQDPNG